MTLPSVYQPTILSQKKLGGMVEITFSIPADLVYLKGHFPEMPIVPGVVQLHWAVEFAQEFFEIPGSISQGKQIKFTTIMAPLAVVCLTLLHEIDKKCCTYTYKTGDKIYSSGSFYYTELNRETLT